jgi:hypothetical protein
LDRDTWYVFERVAITKDLYTGGGRTFLSTDAAQEFRGLIYQQYGEQGDETWLLAKGDCIIGLRPQSLQDLHLLFIHGLRYCFL